MYTLGVPAFKSDIFYKARGEIFAEGSTAKSLRQDLAVTADPWAAIRASEWPARVPVAKSFVILPYESTCFGAGCNCINLGRLTSRAYVTSQAQCLS